MSYAIISLGGKQYRVQEGEKLLVDRLPHDESKTFHPDILMIGGDGAPDFEAKGVQVTARVVRHTLGEKIRIGKYRPKKGYRRHTGYRSRLSQIEIESIGKKAASRPAAKTEEPAAVEKPKAPKAAKLPAGYEEMTVVQIGEAAPSWSAAEVDAALAYERDHAARKGALGALESAKEKA